MSEFHEKLYEARGQRVVVALKKNGFDALYVPTAELAAQKVLEFVQPGVKVGFGGSATVASMNIQELAAKKGAVILDHNNPDLSAEEKAEMRRAELLCDVFISGSNAVTLDGFLFNVDASGNRVAALSFGPKKTIVVAGINKVVANLAEAEERMKAYAAPINNIRLSRPNPCVAAGYCVDCAVPTRICRIYHILKRKPSMSDFTVIIVGEELGF